jgi:hypothetical protein
VRTLADDPSPDAERVLIEWWRRATPTREFAMISGVIPAIGVCGACALRLS